jgi:hypothetical protein
MFLAFVLLLAWCFYKGQRCFKVPFLIVPRVAGPNADETQADWVRESKRFGRLGTLSMALALVLCTFVYGILSGTLTGECGPGENCKPPCPLLPFPPFLFRPGSSTVSVCMCIVPVFDGNGMVFVDDNHFGPAVQFPDVVGVIYSRIF